MNMIFLKRVRFLFGSKIVLLRYSSITACTVVQAVVKATSQSNGKGQILTPWGSETPEQISMKLGIYNRAAGMTTRANPCGAATTWVVWANTWKNTCSPRPPTLSQRHMDLHVWSYSRPDYIFQLSSKSVQEFRSPRGSKFGLSHYFG